MRNHLQNWKLIIVICTMLGLCLVRVPVAFAQASDHLTVSVTGQSLIAGFNNTVSITVTNNYSGYIAIYDVDISPSLPAPLVEVGDNHWHYDSIQYGQSVTITFPVYAPSSAAGSSYQGTLTATYKQLGDVSYTTESHLLSLSVTGYINLVVYGIQITPSEISSGGNTTISGNILNDGNLASYNANVTIASDILIPGSQNSVFLGEVDPNIPRPFSAILVFKQGLQPGNYTLNVTVSATDNNRPGVPILGQANTPIQVIRQTQTGATRGPTHVGVVQQIFTFLRDLFNAFFGSSTA